MKILISGVWASNKGDRAIATYLIMKLLNNSSVKEIYVSANDPLLLKKYVPENVNVINMGYLSNNKITRGICKKIGFPILIDAVNNNKKLKLIKFIAHKDFIDILNKVDYILFTGGHHITTMREKDSIYTMTYELGLINRSFKRYLLCSQTIGPLDFIKSENKQYIKNLLNGAEKIYIRDSNSKQVIDANFKCLNNIYSSYDLVFGLKELLKETLDDIAKENKVGISIFYSNFKTEKEINDYIKKVIEICRVISNYNLRICFFPMETEEKELLIINKIIKELRNESIHIVDTNVSTLEQLIEMKKCRFYIGHKTHSVIISLMLGIPLIALCYHEKTYDFMKMFNNQEYAIKDDEYTNEWFKSKFESLIKNEEKITKKLEENGIRISHKVNEDYDEALKNE